MTDFNGNILIDNETQNDLDFVYQIQAGNPSANFVFFNTTSSETVYYLMRAIDPDCGILTYRTWVVIDTPDLNGSQYVGARCGANPLTNIVVAAKWT